MPTAVAENYLKQLYYGQQAASGELVRVGDLAAAIGVTPGTATTMVKSLARSGWAVYAPRTGARLTRRGERGVQCFRCLNIRTRRALNDEMGNIGAGET